MTNKLLVVGNDFPWTFSRGSEFGDSSKIKNLLYTISVSFMAYCWRLGYTHPAIAFGFSRYPLGAEYRGCGVDTRVCFKSDVFSTVAAALFLGGVGKWQKFTQRVTDERRDVRVRCLCMCVCLNHDWPCRHFSTF